LFPCDGEAAGLRPLVKTERWIDWQIPDPRDMPPDEFRQVRNLIGAKVRELLATL
jgi:protein-tyrosine-phosphatase